MICNKTCLLRFSASAKSLQELTTLWISALSTITALPPSCSANINVHKRDNTKIPSQLLFSMFLCSMEGKVPSSVNSTWSYKGSRIFILWRLLLYKTMYWLPEKWKQSHSYSVYLGFMLAVGGKMFQVPATVWILKTQQGQSFKPECSQQSSLILVQHCLIHPPYCWLDWIQDKTKTDVIER